MLDPVGKQLADFPGHRHTPDICMDSASQTVIQIGWRQERAHDGKRAEPVQIAYVRGMSYAGAEKYLLYDWPAEQGAPGFINRPTNNMADTRGYRCSLDSAGKLLCAFESAGGNHIFRYEPMLVAGAWQAVGSKKPAGDAYQLFHNSRSEHKTVITRHDPASGALVSIQKFTGRLKNGKANAARVKAGALTGGPAGSALFGGAAASGLPVSDSPPGSAKATGGSYFAALQADFSARLFVAVVQDGGATHALAAREINGRWLVVVGGSCAAELKPLATLLPLQPETPANAGFFAVIIWNAAAAVPAP